jgi:hypothetical protein
MVPLMILASRKSVMGGFRLNRPFEIDGMARRRRPDRNQR